MAVQAPKQISYSVKENTSQNTLEMQGELKEKASDARFVFRPVRERETDTDWTVFAGNAPSSLYLSCRLCERCTYPYFPSYDK